MDSFSFFVPGEPITEGSTRAFASGQRVVVTHDRGPELTAWRIKVAHAAEAAAEAAYWEPRHDGPVEVWAEFRLPRPKSAPKSRKHAQTKPDLDKLQRAIGDALAPYKRPGVMVRISKALDHLTGQSLTSIDDVRNTPAGATIIDADGLTFSRGYDGWDMHGNEYTYADREIDLPATLVVVDGI